MILTKRLAMSRIVRSIAALVEDTVALIALPASAQTEAVWKPETFRLSNGMTAVVLPDHRAPCRVD